VSKVSDTEVKLENNKLQLTATLSLDEKGFLNFKFNSPNNFMYRFTWSEKEQTLENGQVKNYVLYADDLNSYPVGDEETGDSKLLWAGIDFNYHLLSVVFPTQSSHIFKISDAANMVI